MNWKPKFKKILGDKIKYLYMDLEGLCGQCEPWKKTIKINKHLKGELRKITFLHEEFHYLFEVHGLNQTHLPLDVQEIICETFAKHVIAKYNITPKKEK